MLSEKTRAIINADQSQKVDPGDLEALVASEARRMELAAEFTAAHPDVSPIAAIVIGGDLASAERSERWVRQGAEATEVVTFVGSYARFDFAYKMWQEGLIPDEWMFDNLPELWRGSDPDDTRPEYLALWKRAQERWVTLPRSKRVDWEGKRLPTTSYVNDGEALPKGTLTVYRGELGDGSDGPTGIAWSVNPAIAGKFAKTGGLRGHIGDGTVFKVRLPKDRVLAYLTGRGEQEVIFDPEWLKLGAWSPEAVDL